MAAEGDVVSVGVSAVFAFAADFVIGALDGTPSFKPVTGGFAAGAGADAFEAVVEGDAGCESVFVAAALSAGGLAGCAAGWFGSAIRSGLPLFAAVVSLPLACEPGGSYPEARPPLRPVPFSSEA